MLGIVWKAKDTVEVADLPKPTIEAPTDAIVRVIIAGLCGSDLHPYHAREKGLAPGTVMGHEFVGQVEEVGSLVSSVHVGDVVVAPFTTSCGECFYCTHALPCRCTSGQLFGWINDSDGHGLHGAQAEYVRVPLCESTLLSIPDNVPLESGLFTGDILATGYHCTVQSGLHDNPDGVYVVVGCGPVGLLAVHQASKAGVSSDRLFAVDMIPERLQMAAEFGATPLNVKTLTDEGVCQRIRVATDGRGADGSLECVGLDVCVRLAYDVVRPGAKVASIGVNTDEHLPFGPVGAYDKNITFSSGRCPARQYLPTLLSSMDTSTDINRIVTHRRSLSQGVESYKLFDTKSDGCVKLVFYTPQYEPLLALDGQARVADAKGLNVV